MNFEFVLLLTIVAFLVLSLFAFIHLLVFWCASPTTVSDGPDLESPNNATSADSGSPSPSWWSVAATYIPTFKLQASPLPPTGAGDLEIGLETIAPVITVGIESGSPTVQTSSSFLQKVNANLRKVLTRLSAAKARQLNEFRMYVEDIEYELTAAHGVIERISGDPSLANYVDVMRHRDRLEVEKDELVLERERLVQELSHLQLDVQQIVEQNIEAERQRFGIIHKKMLSDWKREIDTKERRYMGLVDCIHDFAGFMGKGAELDYWLSRENFDEPLPIFSKTYLIQDADRSTLHMELKSLFEKNEN